MIAWLMDVAVNHPPGGYLIGAVALAVAGGLLLHVTDVWRRVREVRRQQAIARQQAARPHPAGRHRSVRVVRRVVRAAAPIPRPAGDLAPAELAASRTAAPTRYVGRVEQIPPQRGRS
ncbi:hypothetical protein [Micromonospora sp. WMMD737]|uniref:hypothetical protein n=1 Tax=Micromonospora sp. WMMD737 TaxID=3404113 RepID=UPI003B960759